MMIQCRLNKNWNVNETFLFKLYDGCKQLGFKLSYPR